MERDKITQSVHMMRRKPVPRRTGYLDGSENAAQEQVDSSYQHQQQQQPRRQSQHNARHSVSNDRISHASVIETTQDCGQQPVATDTHPDPDPEPAPEQQQQQNQGLDQDLDQNQCFETSPNSKLQYDVSSGTRTECIVATSIGAIAAITCLISGGVVLRNNQATLGAVYAVPSSTGPEISSFVVNMALTLCTDGMMYSHAVSLRWALYGEGRLQYNTNIRLFTSSRKFGPNKWPANIVALFCLVLTYAASSVLFIVQKEAVLPHQMPYVLIVNGTAVVAMGIGLLGQAAVAAWCLLASRNRNTSILTWSSNPLNATLAAIQHGHVSRSPGRCMLSIHQGRNQWPDNQPAYPQKRQRSMCRAQRAVPLVVVAVWVVAALAVAWAVSIALVFKSTVLSGGEVPFCWDTNQCPYSPVRMNFSPDWLGRREAKTYSSASQAVLCLLFMSLIQGTQSICLHCVELLVNLSRDESIWRNAYKDKGGQKAKASGALLRTDAVKAAASSWENMVLFFAKALLHWIIGQAMSTHIQSDGIHGSIRSDPSQLWFQVQMLYPRLLIFACLTVLLAVFATFLSLRRRRGYLPLALGHLPTLANLVDDWRTDDKGRLWWGDKSPAADVSNGMTRHAGTSPDVALVGPINGELPYAGLQA